MPHPDVTVTSPATSGADRHDRRSELDQPGPASTRAAALLVIGQSLLIFVPLIVLGAAIEWPGSLGDPAEIALPRLLDNQGAVRIGYLAYLVYSVLFLPVAIIVFRWVRVHCGDETSLRTGVGVQIALGVAAASALARSIGIVRWLSTMLPMAERWDVASAAERVALSAQFSTVNDYGGAIGEVLGVSVFAAVWVAVTSLGGRNVRSSWIGRSGALVALLLLGPAVELGGVDPGPFVSVSSTAITLWLIAIGVAMIRSSSSTPAS